ncbi:hypothetical protein [Ekhidna sp.]
MNDDNLSKQIANYFKKRLQKTWKPVIAITFIVAIIVIGMAVYFPGSVRVYNKCNEAEEINTMSFSGIIIEKKDADPYSRVRYLVIESENGKEDILILLHDNLVHRKTRKSFFWEIMNEGDSVKKEAGTFEVGYQKSNQIWEKRNLGFNLCD